MSGVRALSRIALPDRRLSQLAAAGYYDRVPERQFQASIRDAARRLGWLYFHDPDARRCPNCGHFVRDRRPRGKLDTDLCLPPFLAITEAKTAKGTPTPEQRWWLAALARVKYLLVDLWRPSDKEAIRTFLEEPWRLVPAAEQDDARRLTLEYRDERRAGVA